MENFANFKTENELNKQGNENGLVGEGELLHYSGFSFQGKQAQRCNTTRRNSYQKMREMFVNLGTMLRFGLLCMFISLQIWDSKVCGRIWGGGVKS